MYPKATGFRAQNSVGRSVAATSLASASSWRAPGKWSPTVIRSQWCRVKKNTKCLTPFALNSVPLCVHGEGLTMDHQPSWKKLSMGVNGQSDEAPGIRPLPWPQTALTWYANASALIHPSMSLTARPSAASRMMSVVRRQWLDRRYRA